ncbi:MAG: cytochrome c [Bdellovibrio sp.]|nr:cytochrome c [Bdellovibrio sp.]
MTRAAVFVTLIAFGMTLGCSFFKHERPDFIYMPDMVYSPAFKAQKEGAMREPPLGTVPRNFTPYLYSKDPIKGAELAGKELTNLLARTEDVFVRGQVLFNTFCIVCHGKFGEGDGYIVPKFPRPPSLQSDKVRTWPDGRIYHVISAGQNLMPSYATQIDTQDRWAIIHYIRALQRAKHPTPEDLARIKYVNR